MIQPATFGNQPAHFHRLDLDPDRIQPWEDGLRTDPATRSFEWWYYDVRLDDGTRITVELHTKPPIAPPSAPLTPFVSIVMVRPDGTLVVKNALQPAGEFHAGRDGCDVRIGRNYCRGDLGRHEVHVELEGIAIDLELTSELAPWRPATGHVFLGEQQDRFIAWLPSMPRARVVARIVSAGRSERLAGVGYHDHNWGNVATASVVDHWYWGHAHIGPYTVVAIRVVAHAKYGCPVFPAFLVARDGAIVATGTDALELATSDLVVEPTSGVSVANRYAYRLPSPEGVFRFEFTRRRDVLALGFGDARGYLRFVGDARLTDPAGTTLAGDGIWELLSFSPKAPTV